MKRLEEVAEIIMGTSPAGDTYNRNGIGLPLLNGPTEFGNVYPHSTLYTTDSKKECKTGDLIFCVRGNTTGRMNWADKKYSLGRGVCAIRGKIVVETKYIKKCLEVYLPNLLQLASGATMPNLTQSSIKQFAIPYPESRDKIAAILSAYDDLIENNLRRIKILEEMAQNLYREWFVNFRFPGHEHTRFVDSPLGRIPEGWEVRNLKDTCNLIMGQSPKSEFYNDIGLGLPFHQGVTNFGSRFPVTKHYCTVTKRIAQKGDILFSVRAPVGRINIADTRLVIGRGLSAISHKKKLQWFLYHYLREVFKDEDIIGGGTIYKSVTKKDMEDIKILNPQYDTVDYFESIVRPINNLIEALDKKNNSLRQARDLLLPKLITGEIDVSELDIYTTGEQAI